MSIGQEVGSTAFLQSFVTAMFARLQDEHLLRKVGLEAPPAQSLRQWLDRTALDAEGISIPLGIVSGVYLGVVETAKARVLVNGVEVPLSDVRLQIPIDYKAIGEIARALLGQTDEVLYVPAEVFARPLPEPAVVAARQILAAMDVPEPLVTGWLAARRTKNRATLGCEVLAAALKRPVELAPDNQDNAQDDPPN